MAIIPLDTAWFRTSANAVVLLGFLLRSLSLPATLLFMLILLGELHNLSLSLFACPIHTKGVSYASLTGAT